jgi:blue copper oxidase
MHFYIELRFVVNSKEMDNFKLPNSLISFNKLEGSAKLSTFVTSMSMMAMSGGMHKINGKVFKADRIGETVDFNSTQVWEFDNSNGDHAHPMHIRAVSFQVLSHSGSVI